MQSLARSPLQGISEKRGIASKYYTSPVLHHAGSVSPKQACSTRVHVPLCSLPVGRKLQSMSSRPAPSTGKKSWTDFSDGERDVPCPIVYAPLPKSLRSTTPKFIQTYAPKVRPHRSLQKLWLMLSTVWQRSRPRSLTCPPNILCSPIAAILEHWKFAAPCGFNQSAADWDPCSASGDWAPCVCKYWDSFVFNKSDDWDSVAINQANGNSDSLYAIMHPGC